MAKGRETRPFVVPNPKLYNQKQIHLLRGKEGIRTPDAWIFSPPLYQLSYRSKTPATFNR